MIRILQGDVRDMLKTLPAESVHCVVTSPPYWGLRDYGTASWDGGDPECNHKADLQKERPELVNGVSSWGPRDGRPTKECPHCGAKRIDRQIGMEPTMGEHIETMVGVFREVRRVLRKDGTCWLNYGDCYATAPNGRSAADTKATGNDDRTFRDKPFSTVGGTLKPKDLCMIPNRLAIALQDDGWWVRSEIIWSKPNPMPESVTDRPATAHEKVWLLTKSARYYYDAEAVRRPMAAASVDRLSQDVGSQEGSHRAHAGGKTNGTMKAVGRKTDKQRGHSRRHAGFNDRWDAMPREEQQANGANLRNVWTIPTKGYSEAHFATFPPALVEPCIKAGCPADGTVLDPFGGSGTTGMVADRLGRNAILIELNPEYADLIRKRIHDDAGMFAEVS
ncbi:MAG: DNA-methyltransferase [Aestuariivirgaceae bacterium]